MKVKFTFPSKKRRSKFQPYSTMASTKRSPSPPPMSPQPGFLLRDPLEPEIKPPPRNYLEERITKRRRIEENQDKSLIHGLELHQHATKILESNDLTSLQEAIEDYSNSKNQQSLITIFKSFSLHYPNAFSFKLAKILQLNPSVKIRTETANLLSQTLTDRINSSMSSFILFELKKPLLDSLLVESEDKLFNLLCESIGLLADRLYRSSVGSWDELLEYIIVCLSGDAKFSNKKGLMLLTELPINVVQNKEFWLSQGNFDLVFGNILEWIYSTDKELKEFAFNASISLMLLSMDLERTEVSDSLLPVLLNIIDQNGEEELMVNRIKRLTDLVNLDDGTIFHEKYHDVFWCMIRVAEANDASEVIKVEAGGVIKELDTLNVNVMECLIHNLSHEEVRRVVMVAMNMFSCVVDDPLWYDVDNKACKEAGMTEAFECGEFLLNCLSIDGNQNVFLPTVNGMITMRYAFHVDWRFRHAAMFAIASIADKKNFFYKGKNMIQHFEQVAILVLMSLDDLNHRVLWATMHAIKHLSECKELFMRAQYHKKFIPKLIPIIRSNPCARVQSYAVIALRSLVKICGIDRISPFGEQIVLSLLELLKHEKQKLQEEAIVTLKSIAVLEPRTFRENYYKTTMEALKGIVFDKNVLPRLLFCAKCLECMVYLVRNVGLNNFKELEVDQVVEFLISLEGKLSNTEYSTRSIILKALDQICGCPTVSIDKFLDKIMPMLLGSAEPCLDVTVDNSKDDSQDDDVKNLVETMRVRACNTLSCCAVRSYINFSPHIGKVIKMFIRLLGCSSFQIRKASILGLPKLLLSLIVGGIDDSTKSCMTFIIVQSLIEVLKKEINKDLSKIVLGLLARCIQTSRSFFTKQSIKIIADEINDTIKKTIKIELEKKAKVGTLKKKICQSLSTEETIEEVVINLIATTIGTFKDRFMLHVDDLMSNVVVFLADDKPDRVIAFAISIFNVIIPLFPDKLAQYHNRYYLTSSLALRKNYPCAKMHATRAIGICAMFGGDQFKGSSTESVSILYNVLRTGFSTSRETAVAALGKIYEFHRDSLDLKVLHVLQEWLNCLPLKHDYNEARYAHGLLSKLIQRSDEHLFGSKNENLPKIISIVKKILSGPDRLGTEEAINQMIDFIEQYGGMGIGDEELADLLKFSNGHWR